MTEYQKLVRDRIPQMIEAAGEKPYIRILDDAEYLLRLESKLDEEVAEFHRDRNPEELADILEVVLALAETLGCSREELIRLFRNKHEARGGFENRIFLIGKE